jgi:Ser/Thr protein kinase RdoA (MazF antagonist)
MSDVSESAARLALAAGWWPAGAIAPLGDGHIHATWLVEHASAANGRFVLQRISTTVFADPASLMTTVASVVAHVSARAPGWVPTLEPTRSGALFHVAADHTWWRLWRYIEGGRTLPMLRTSDEAEAAGRAFGRFQQLLADLKAPVPDPIPGFMQLDHYLRLLDAVRESAGARADASEIVPLLDVVDRRRDMADAFATRDRLVHADCKVDNLLFAAADHRVICVLDLDTVMRGHWAWDAGDLIRSAAGDADGVSVERFGALVRGMAAEGAIDAIPEEWALAPRYVTLMLAVRFLTDHLQGDRYFRVSRAGENLARARVQFRLFDAFERQEAAMVRAVRAG